MASPGDRPGSPSEHRPERVDHHVGRRALHEVAAGAGPQRVEEVVVVDVHGQHDDRGLGHRRRDRPGGLDAAAGHVDVEHADRGLPPAGERDRAGGVAGLADDLEPAAFEDLGDGLAHRDVVVGQHHGRGRRRSPLRDLDRDAGAAGGRRGDRAVAAEPLGPLAHRA